MHPTDTKFRFRLGKLLFRAAAVLLVASCLIAARTSSAAKVTVLRHSQMSKLRGAEACLYLVAAWCDNTRSCYVSSPNCPGTQDPCDGACQTHNSVMVEEGTFYYRINNAMNVNCGNSVIGSVCKTNPGNQQICLCQGGLSTGNPCTGQIYNTNCGGASLNE